MSLEVNPLRVLGRGAMAPHSEAPVLIQSAGAAPAVA